MNYSYPTLSDHAPSPTKTLIFGILGLAFSCSFFLSLVGVIFSALCLSRANEYYRILGSLCGKVKVGRILSKIGLILGIVMMALFLLYVLSFLITYFGIKKL